MPVTRWNPALDGEFSEAALRRTLEAEGCLVARHIYPPGTVFPDHAHHGDRVSAVVSGRFRLVVGGHLAVLGPGDRVTVPHGVRHSAAVVGDEPVVSLEAVRRPFLS